MEGVTLIGKGWIEYDMPCVIKCVKLTAKYFLAVVSVSGRHLRFG